MTSRSPNIAPRTAPAICDTLFPFSSSAVSGRTKTGRQQTYLNIAKSFKLETPTVCNCNCHYFLFDACIIFGSPCSLLCDTSTPWVTNKQQLNEIKQSVMNNFENVDSTYMSNAGWEGNPTKTLVTLSASQVTVSQTSLDPKSTK